ncbi:MAG: metal ABC transporter permease [Verrucomicrobiales bacterium]|nr:metal ABC transporter permease [Verrucomicrobiales bacterium]
MTDLIPEFSWETVFLTPWREDVDLTIWIVATGFLVTTACGLIGHYLLLRRLALVGDAISHSILPGLVAAFAITGTTALWASMLGALVAGLVTVALIELIHRHSRIKPDAAICIVFTTLFALGVAMMSVLEAQGSIHLDADCVLYGEMTWVAIEPPLQIGGWTPVEMPGPVLRLLLLVGVLVAGIAFFYKELLLTSFDPGLARALGMRTQAWHYGLMGGLALVVVSVFESVGAILPVAMLIVPPMFAAELSDRLSIRMVWTVVHAAAAAVLGMHLAVWLNCTAAGAMVVCSSALFVLVWVGGLAVRRLRLRRVMRGGGA